MFLAVSITQVLNIINTAIVACSDWFNSIWTASNMSTVYFCIIFIVLSIRFIVKPYVGVATFTAASDRVKKASKANKKFEEAKKNSKKD